MHEDPRELVHAAIRGDAQAFDSMFGRNIPKLRAFIRLRMSRGRSAKESVTDIAQSVCREVLEDMDDFDYQGDEAFRAWLHEAGHLKTHGQASLLHPSAPGPGERGRSAPW